MLQLTARDVMTADPITLSPGMSAAEAASLLLENEISGAPVVDRHGELVGVISLADIARGAGEAGAVYVEHSDPDYFLRSNVQDANFIKGWEEAYNVEDLEHLHVEGHGLMVRDLMTPTLYTVEENTPVPRIASTMSQGHVHRLLVLRDGRLVGIVTSMDLLRLLAEA